MKATEAKLLEFLKKSPQFVIPIYQRTYSWGERECRQLWDDILRTRRNDVVSAHFVGSIVYVEKGLYSVSSQSPLLVIDGQQRLTTVALLVEALARTLGEGEPLEGFSAKKLRNYYLLNPLEDELPALCKGLAKLVIVDISLNRDQDNPQLIFESLNSTGRELSQADLIRNFILMGLKPQLQTKLYEQYWRPMEVDFGQEGYAIHFDSFMRHYLTVKTGDIPNVREVYEAFKQHARSPDVASAGVESYVFRRAVCGIPTNSMNKTFATFTRVLKKDRYLESVAAHFLLLPSYRRFPTDDEFKRELQIKDLYNFRSRSYWLRRLENHARKEHVPVDEYTIEHILPQNENLSAKWKADLGAEWERIQKTWLHTLGNLTLTGSSPRSAT